jgi:1-acyl-sn-glycerol-3-phosphate acyltransferase
LKQTEATLSQPHAVSDPERQAQLATLTEVNIADMLRGVGLEHVQHGRTLLRWVLRKRAQQFARKIVYYDDLVGARGLAAGGAWAVSHFAARLAVVDQEHLPRNGPVLIAANHPGLCDTTALFAAINRPDLRVVAALRPFLHALPHTSRHLLYVGDTQRSRVSAVRAVARHLRDGGAVLTFPSGQIEPDPAAQSGAVQALVQWNESIAVFARFAPAAAVVPAIVSGVVSPAALNHPLTRIRRHPRDQQWLAGLLQLQVRSLLQGTVRVQFGQPISAKEPNIMTAVRAEARRLIVKASVR